MGKRCAGKKRGIQRGVAKHQIGSKLIAGKKGDCTVLGIEKSAFFALGKRCFDFWFFCCDQLHLVPFKRTETGEYVPLDQRSRILHCVAWLIQFLLFLHKSWGLGFMLFYQDIKIETFMCASLFIIYLVTFCLSLGVIARPKETMDLFNSWPFLLSYLKELRSDKPSPFHDLSLSLQLIVTFFATQGVAIAASLLSLTFSNLPTCYFPTMRALGVIPEGLLPVFAWQLIFFPLEYATYLLPMLIAPLTGCPVLIIVGIYRLYMNELRRIQITSLEIRAKVEHLYVSLELYSRICYVWIKFSLPLFVFAMSLTIIITFFVSVRYSTELPLFVHMLYISNGGGVWLILFWVSFDVITVTRDSVAILGQLTSMQAPYFRKMTNATRKMLMKRAKAMRVVELPIGGFAEFSVTVPATVWEEIVNQVVFLLTL